MRATEECGCKHDGVHWLHLCAPHAAQDALTSAQWHADYLRTQRPDPARIRALGLAEGLV